MNKFLTLTVLLMLVLAVASNPLESKRKSRCNSGKVADSTNCRNQTSFFKRIYEAYKRGQVEDADSPEGRVWDVDAQQQYQKKYTDIDNVEEKLRLLNEILEDLELDNNDLK